MHARIRPHRGLFLFVAATAAFGLKVPTVAVRGVPMDWTHRHVVFSNPGTEAEAIENGTHERWLKITNEPRYAMQQVHRRQPAGSGAKVQVDPALSVEKVPAQKKKAEEHLDWSVALGNYGGGGVNPNTFPAKWSFDTTTASCASDFVVFLTVAPGNGIVAYHNLYSGCGGTVPSVYWEYNTGDISILSPVLSGDGSQVAFVQGTSQSTLVLLKWAANPSLVTLSNTPAASYRNCTAPCMTTFAFGGSSGDDYAAPFYDYTNDVLYVGDGGGNLHKFTGVFNGTPAEAVSPWPVSVTTSALSSPVLDSTSGRIFVGSINGSLYAVNSSTGAAVGTSSRVDYEFFGLLDAPLVDSSAGMVYAFIGDDGAFSCYDGEGNYGCSGVFQFPVNFTNGSGKETQVGYGEDQLYSGAFDYAYLTSNSSSPTGHLYVCGQSDENKPQELYQVSITSNVMGSATASSYLVGNGGVCSPVTEFYNSSVSKDYVFLGSPEAYQGCSKGTGCVFGFNVTNGIPSTAEFAPAAGGTGGIVVDNAVGSGTLAGASEIYFETLSTTGLCATSGVGSICGVQDSQTSLATDPASSAPRPITTRATDMKLR